MMNRWSRTGPFVMALATCCAPVPSRSLVPGDDWVTLATADRSSPAAGQPGLTQRWTGADGKPVEVAVAAPRIGRGSPVVTLAPSNPALAGAFAAAVARLSAAGGGTLRLQPGTYAVDNPVDGPGLLVDGASDVVIEGAGARIVFARWGDGIVVRNSARVAIRGVSLGYARAPVITASVRAIGGRTILVPVDGAALPAGATVHQISRNDARGPGFLANENRLLLGRRGNAAIDVGKQGFTIADDGLRQFATGSRVDVKLSYYAGAAIRVADTRDTPTTHDVTIDGVTIRNSAGAGIAVDVMDRGLAVVGSQIGMRQGAGDGPTIAYDGVHVTSIAGDVLVQRNHITATGDDAINLASPIYAVSGLGDGGAQATIAANNFGIGAGVGLALFDADLEYVGRTTVASRQPRAAGGDMTVAFSAPVSRGTSVRFARNLRLLASRYAVIGNLIDGCSCHGLLVQGPNGLVRDNQFRNLRANAIRIVASGMWKEGAGARNLLIERNGIDQTGTDDRRGIVWAAITTFAEGAAGAVPGQAPLSRSPVHSDLVIRDNVITNVAQGCISIASSSEVTITNNTCRAHDRFGSTSRILVERSAPADAVRRLPAKARYIADGDGIWIDPLTTSAVSTGPTRR